MVRSCWHCVSQDNAYQWPEVEVHPWMAANRPRLFSPSSWDSGHKDCASRIRVSYPCGYDFDWCSGWWGVKYPCNHRVKWCTRYTNPPSDCTWRYDASLILVPDSWKLTQCQASDDGSCSQSDFQHDIALVVLRSQQGGLAADRAGSYKSVVWQPLASFYALPAMMFEITGYPGDKVPYMVTATGRIHSVENDKMLLKHTIDASKGQSGAGVFHNNMVYGVHVFGGATQDGARMIDPFWFNMVHWLGGIRT